MILGDRKSAILTTSLLTEMREVRQELHVAEKNERKPKAGPVVAER